jgi:thymidylate synthase ThyX
MSQGMIVEGGFSARVLANSLSPENVRLITVEATYPRFVHAELMTHRMFSRNAASSRAIPIETMIQRVLDDPAMPVHWGKNQKGMQAEEELPPVSQFAAKQEWLIARDQAVRHARFMVRLGVHKQIVNRLLESFAWITVIITATEWNNFFKQRCHPDAQPEIQKIACLIRDAIELDGAPTLINYDDWHLPLIRDEDRAQFNGLELCRLATARCARVSYTTHDGLRDPAKDFELYAKLVNSGHWSPFEHIATPLRGGDRVWGGNLRGWQPYRKQFPLENTPGAPPVIGE